SFQPEIRRQKTEDRGQRTEDRGQRTEDRGQRTEVCGSVLCLLFSVALSSVLLLLSSSGRLQLGALLAGFDQATEQLDVEPRGAGRGRLPLHADREPGVGLRLDRFNNAVQGASADAEAARQARDGLTVLAI